MSTDPNRIRLEDFGQIFLTNLSVDCVIFGYEENTLKVLLRKEFIPSEEGVIQEELKLPGNHVRRDETINDTAARILKEQTGLENIFAKQFSVFSDPGRLYLRTQDYNWLRPRIADDRVVTVGFYSLLNISDIDNSQLMDVAIWQNAYEVKELMFDHNQIYDEALKKLRNDLLLEPLAFELLPEKFTLTQMQKLYEAIFNTKYDKRNYRRRINKMHYLIELEEKQSGVSHKPARLYSYSREIYEQTKKERFDFQL
ncbi:MAG: NUDIX domain-containing protein [Dysgonamonadaceae bacterium]